MAKDPFYQSLQESLGKVAEAVETDSRKSKSRLSPKLESFALLLDDAGRDDLKRVIAHKWHVAAYVEDQDHESNIEGNLVKTGYRPLFKPLAVQQCVPDVLAHLRRNGASGAVRVVFLEIGTDKPDSATFEMGIEPEPEKQLQIDPNAGLAQMMLAVVTQMQQQAREDRQLLMQTLEKIGGSKQQSERDLQAKMEAMEARHRDEINRVLAQAQGAVAGDKRLQLGQVVEQGAYQAITNSLQAFMQNGFSPQAHAQPALSAPVGGVQGLAAVVKQIRDDEMAKQELKDLLPSLLGGAQREPSLLEQVQQWLPIFMLLKNSGNASGPQLENMMAQFMNQRGGQPQNVSPFTGLPVPDAAPANDADAALSALAAQATA